MDGESDKITAQEEGSERPFIDAAWAQYESVVGQKRTTIGDHLRSFNVPGYRVLSQIHRGGQGVVYQAIQESTHRKVAIKVLKEGPLADHAELARFDREVEVLSRLHHPHIVAIHDRGSASGHNYLVMDYIPGRPLDAYVAGEALSTREILQLCHSVCEAVNVAHLRGIIHRDLKPSNIRVDDEGKPHVLDFGLAKLTQEPRSGAEAMTVTGQFVGSLPWASPEQAAGRSELLDIRSDVYSLGVLLYQLLTRRFPYPVAGRMDDVVRNILDTSAGRPSTWNPEVDRDVDIIVLKCLAKDPERRYQSAGELARDIRRYLDGEPIEARPATSLYQFRQFARRNKGLVGSLAAIFLILIIATAISFAFGLSASRQRETAQASLLRAEKAEAEADARADELEQVVKFQQAQLSGIDVPMMGVRLRADVLQMARRAAERSHLNPGEVEARAAELESLLAGGDFTDLALQSIEKNFFDPALAAIQGQFDSQPLVKARLLQTSATTLYDLGLYDVALAPQETALAIRRNTLGNDHPDTIASTSLMGAVLQALGRLQDAEVFFTEALATNRRLLGNEHPETLMSMNDLALLQHAQGKYEEAERLYAETLRKRRQFLGDEHPDTISSINNMGFFLQAQGELAQAEPYLLEALEKFRRVLGNEDPRTLVAVNNMGALFYVQGKVSEAEPYFREAIDISRHVLGQEHHNTLRAIDNMSVVLRAQDRLAEAEVYSLESLEKHRRVLGADHPDTIVAISNMGALRQAQGSTGDAERLLSEAVERAQRVLGDDHPDTFRAMNNLGSLLLSEERVSEAEPYLQDALQGRRRILGDKHAETLVAIVNVAALYNAQGSPEAAIEILVPHEQSARQAFIGGHAVRLGRFLTAMGCAQAKLHYFASAEAYLLESNSILVDAKGTTPRDHSDLAGCLVELYEAWDAGDPTLPHAEEANRWRGRLKELSQGE